MIFKIVVAEYLVKAFIIYLIIINLFQGGPWDFKLSWNGCIAELSSIHNQVACNQAESKPPIAVIVQYIRILPWKKRHDKSYCSHRNCGDKLAP
jgi:hypothetical protein